ncbi:MAG: hypothetical protein RR335_06755 [Eubacterium sp.]
MASFDTRFAFEASKKFEVALDRYSTDCTEIAKEAIYEGAKIVADEMKNEINKIPRDRYRYLKKGEKYNVAPEGEKKDLKESFGITKMKEDMMSWNVKIGFDGYGKYKTKKYPNGVPNQLIARAIESGSSVRGKYPFVRNTIKRKKREVVKKMDDVIEKETMLIFK